MKNMNKITSFLTAVVLVFNIFPICIVNAEETVSISTVNDFKDFTEKCVYDEYSKNKKFVLQNDIDLNGVEIKGAEVFCGVFEGGGHSIRNLKLSFEGSNKGLFCSVTKDAQIKDLNVTGTIKSTAGTDTESVLKQRASTILSKADIQMDNMDKGSKVVGGIVGYNEGKIVNCSFGGTLSGQKQVGGIAGYNAMNGIIDSCAGAGTVNGDSEVGGVVGYNEGRVKLSKNSGTVCREANENTVNVGGIAGNNEGAVVICTNNGAVGGDSFGDNVGGVVGTQSGEIRECINNGAVKGRRSIGGICGRFEPYTDIDLSYESAKAAIQKQADELKNDLTSAKGKLLDYGLQLLTGTGDFSTIMSALGLGGSVSNARTNLDMLTDSAVKMMDGVTNAVNSANDTNITQSLKEAVEQARESLEKGGDDLSSFTDETKQSVRDVSDSLNKSLESLDDFLDEFDGKGDEITKLVDNLNDSIDKGKDDVDDVKGKLSTRLDNFEDSIDEVTDNLDTTNTELQKLIRQLKYVSGDMNDSITGAFDDISKVVNSASDELTNLKKTIEELKKLLGDIKIPTLPTLRPIQTNPPVDTEEVNGYEVESDVELDSGYDVEPNVVGMIKDMLFTTAYAVEDENKTAISDLQSTNISIPRLIGNENADTALIKYCINNGEVEGSEIVGGVSGSMGFESSIRSGDSITLPDGTKVSSDSILKAVIDSCISYGNVTAESKYSGGMCGKSDIGNIENSLTTGEIRINDGSYSGGIVGFSSGDIKNCIAVNDVFGNDHIGGIAGGGKNITTSYALPRLDGKKDNSGAIAGFVNGEVTNCYFIEEGLSGISGMNLEGRAQSVNPEDMTTSDGTIPTKMAGLSTDDFYMSADDLYMPQIKTIAKNDAENIGAILQSKSTDLSRFRFNVVFKDKGTELKSMTVDYGTVLNDSDIPKLTADGSEVPIWDRDVKSPIIRHTTFVAEYNKATTTISSGEEPPLMLVEGVFDDGTTVSVKEEDIDREFSGYDRGNAYSFTLSKDAYGTVKVHIRDEKKQASKIGIQIDGKWSMIDCSMDGSYAVFETVGPSKFVILYKHTSPILPIAIGVGVIVVLGVLFLIFRRKVWKK